jgi:LL-diaminopimelate aminotransferase
MKVKASERLGDVEEYYFSIKLRQIAEMQSQGIHVINLGIGSPDLPAAQSVIDTLKAATSEANANQYQSYSGLPQLRGAFANWYKNYYDVILNPDNEILPLIGSKEGIMHISMAFLNIGDKVLIPNPGYPTYSAATQLAGGEVVYYNLKEENNWQPDFEALEKLDLSKVKIMWVNYPNMPTGASASGGLFKKLIAFGMKHHILICNDNPYSFILNDNFQSILRVDGAKEIALELNSLSKSHNMAGWRIGMLAGHSDYLSTVLRFKSNMDSGMYKPVQRAAIAALGLPKSWYSDLNKIYEERQQWIYKLFDAIDCEYDRSKGGMFVWAKVPASYKNSYELSDELLDQHHVFITPGGIFGTQGDNYIRASLCNTVDVIKAAVRRIE